VSYLPTNQNNFPHIPYPSKANPKATVLTGGCGPCAALMVLENMTPAKWLMKDWIAWVISVGARVSGGTNMHILSAAMAEKFGFIVTKTSDEAELAAHLRAGGKAVGNCGGANGDWRGLFSTAGHFFAIVGITKDGLYIVLDPNWTSNKFTNQSNSLSRWRSQRAKQGPGSIVYVEAQYLHTDTKTRTPSYYLFSLPKQKSEKEEIEVADKIYKTIDDVPAWARKIVQAEMSIGVLKGASKNNLDITDADIKSMHYTYRHDPVYLTVEDVPDWGKSFVAEYVRKGKIKETSPGRIDLHYSTLRALIIENAE